MQSTGFTSTITSIQNTVSYVHKFSAEMQDINEQIAKYDNVIYAEKCRALKTQKYLMQIQFNLVCLTAMRGGK